MFVNCRDNLSWPECASSFELWYSFFICPSGLVIQAPVPLQVAFRVSPAKLAAVLARKLPDSLDTAGS
jgi:hypothetical protein